MNGTVRAQLVAAVPARGTSASRSPPITSENACSGCSSLQAAHRAQGAALAADRALDVADLARGPSAAAASSHIARRSSNGASGLPNACWNAGTNQSSSTGAVSSTYSAASWWATCGGLKLPPKSATRIGPRRSPAAAPGGAARRTRARTAANGASMLVERRARLDRACAPRRCRSADRSPADRRRTRTARSRQRKSSGAELARRRDQRDARCGRDGTPPRR